MFKLATGIMAGLILLSAGSASGAERHNPARHVPAMATEHRGHGHDARAWGLGLLAGTVILLAAAEARAAAPPPAALVTPVYAQLPTYPGASVPSWYYCAAARAYYPYVRECATGWTKVPAYPPR